MEARTPPGADHAAGHFGRVLLWLVAVGLVSLAFVAGQRAIWGYGHRAGARRVRNQVSAAAKAVVYAALGFSAAAVALGSGSSSAQSQQHTTSGVLA